MVTNLDSETLQNYVSSYRKEIAKTPLDIKAANALCLCFTRLRMYDRAKSILDPVIQENPEAADLLFLRAVVALEGKKAFMAKRADINSAINYLDAANMFERNPIHYQLLAYIKADFFDRKGYKIEPSSDDDRDRAKELGISSLDISTLYELLNVQK